MTPMVVADTSPARRAPSAPPMALPTLGRLGVGEHRAQQRQLSLGLGLQLVSELGEQAVGQLLLRPDDHVFQVDTDRGGKQLLLRSEVVHHQRWVHSGLGRHGADRRPVVSRLGEQLAGGTQDALLGLLASLASRHREFVRCLHSFILQALTSRPDSFYSR